MKLNITKKNIIVAAVGFLAGVIIATSGFLIFRGCTHKEHKRIVSHSYSQSQNFDAKETKSKTKQSGSENNSNSAKQSKKNKSDKSSASTPESSESTTGDSSNP